MNSQDEADLAEKKRRIAELDMKNYKSAEESTELEDLKEWMGEFEMTEGIIREEFQKFRNAQQQLAKTNVSTNDSEGVKKPGSF